MINLLPATEDEMIASFLRAEFDPSSHWSDCIKKGLAAFDAEPLLIDAPNLKDPRENDLRKEILNSYRGYKVRQGQFDGFPEEVTWHRVELEPSDFETMQYMAHSNWKKISSGTRLVTVGAHNYSAYASDERFRHIADIARSIRDNPAFRTADCGPAP